MGRWVSLFFPSPLCLSAEGGGEKVRMRGWRKESPSPKPSPHGGEGNKGVYKGRGEKRIT